MNRSDVEIELMNREDESLTVISIGDAWVLCVNNEDNGR
jgi:hypothetical protein